MQRERNKVAMAEMVQRFQCRPGDTGSPPVQSEWVSAASCRVLIHSRLCSRHPDAEDPATYRVHDKEQEGGSGPSSTGLPSAVLLQDYNGLRLLVQLVHRRRRLLQLLSQSDPSRHELLLADLKIRRPTHYKYPLKPRKH